MTAKASVWRPGRRDILRGAVVCACCAGGSLANGPAQAERFRPRMGCVVRGKDADRALGSGILSSRHTSLPALVDGSTRTTGDLELNRRLDQALQRLASTFGVWPQVGFYDDGDQPNALAISYAKAGRPHYAVVFGKTYFRQMFAYDPSGITFLQTAAHEFAHIWMYKSGGLDALLEGHPTVKRAELHADYLSVYYLGLRKRNNPGASFRSAGLKRWESGDRFHQDPHHHGTPRQRLEAAEAGFILGFKDGVEPAAAFKAATAFVQRY